MSEVNSTDEYREILGFPGYRVGKDGTVWSRWRKRGSGRGRAPIHYQSDSWHRLKPGRVGCYGHLQVNLGRGNSRRVGPLVLSGFVGPCPQNMECCHRDGDATNNRLENLRWGTSADNTNDQRRHGTLIGGERHGMAKLSNSQVDEIRLLAGMMTQRQIAARFGIKQPHVSGILAGKKRTASSHDGRGVR